MSNGSSYRGKPVLFKTAAVLGTVFVSLGVFFGSQFFSALVVVLALIITGHTLTQAEDMLGNNVAMQLALVSLVAVIIIFALFKILSWMGQEPRKFLLLDKFPTYKQLGQIALAYIIYFVLLVLVTIVLGQFTNLNVDQAQDLGVAEQNSLPGLAAIFVMLVILPPLYEEILFRGFLFNMLKKYGSLLVAWLLTCLLFGAAHLEFGNLNWIAAIDTLIFSAFLIYISQRHQSLYSAMLMHATKNAIAFYVLFVR